MGDHTINIAENVQYMIDGYTPATEPYAAADRERLPLAVD
jgi:phosphate uptake regulator